MRLQTPLFHILMLLALFFSLPFAVGAELKIVKSCPDGTCDNANLYIIGKINTGDAAHVMKVLEEYGPGIGSLYLRSPGGSMYESIRIGTMANELMLNTFAPSSITQCGRTKYCTNPRANCTPEHKQLGVTKAYCTCLSGCFLIWIGGVNRYGDIVGMHRPWDTSRKMGSLPYKQAAKQYKKWLADLKLYLTKMEVPETYFSKFIETVRSGDIRMLTNEDYTALHQNPSITEWLSNRCGQWTTQENEEISNLNRKKYQGKRHNRTRLKQLLDKLTARQVCKENARRQARETAFKKMFSPTFPR